MAWTDSHTHLDDERMPGGVAGAVADARAAGVARMVTVGTDAARSRAAIDIAAAHDGVWATAGLHPHDAVHGIDGIEALLDEPKVVAVGECGLDYYYDHSPRQVQQRVFAEQVALACARDLPLVVHTRDAWDDTFAILRTEGLPPVVVFHCFTGDPDDARRCLDLGAYLSFSGIVSFARADGLRAAAALCPADRLLVETDAPYLAPVPHRGKVNRPAWVPAVGAAVAAARGQAVEAVEHDTSVNAAIAFRLPPLVG